MGAADRVPAGAIVIGDKENKLGGEKIAKDKPPKDKDPKEIAKDTRPGKFVGPPPEPPDPKKIWQDALARGVDDPGLIIACADYLFEHRQFDHATEFLKAALRQGIVARPWVYESLAVALEASGGSLDEIERARVSAVDLEPQDARGYLRASQAMASHKRYDRAVAFCRQAALLQPNTPDPYAEALVYAELGKDPEAMEWAAGNLLRQDWPSDNDDLQAKARAKMDALAKVLQTERRNTQADRMVAAVERVRERDLVIRLIWQGDTDLDLKVREPIGTVCSALQRQTAGGGALLGDTFAVTGSETYVAAEAFPGNYYVTVERVWGRPLGAKATLEITRHQGTPQETVSLVTLVFDKNSPTYQFKLEDGRRTSVASVPPPTGRRLPNAERADADRVLNKLRTLADPLLAGSENGMRGGLASTGTQAPDKYLPNVPRVPNDVAAVQAKVDPYVANSMDMTAQAAVSPDRREVRFSLRAIFQTASRVQSVPVVTNPLVPGAPDPGPK
jgi:tetratricopeptide (TPR) repeat protein